MDSMLRCVFCNRSEAKVTLSDNFMCTDRDDCMVAQNRKNRLRVVTIKFDGACLGGNGAEGQPLGVGVATFIDGQYSEEYSGCKPVAWGSNNDAEFIALLYALNVAAIMRKQDNFTFRIFGDSQLIINIFNEECAARGKFKEYQTKAVVLRKKLGASLLSVSWIPRSENSVADALSKEALLLHKL